MVRSARQPPPRPGGHPPPPARPPSPPSDSPPPDRSRSRRRRRRRREARPGRGLREKHQCPGPGGRGGGRTRPHFARVTRPPARLGERGARSPRASLLRPRTGGGSPGWARAVGEPRGGAPERAGGLRCVRACMRACRSQREPAGEGGERPGFAPGPLWDTRPGSLSPKLRAGSSSCGLWRGVCRIILVFRLKGGYSQCQVLNDIEVQVISKLLLRQITHVFFFFSGPRH